jgi:hypothetical protein
VVWGFPLPIRGFAARDRRPGHVISRFSGVALPAASCGRPILERGRDCLAAIGIYLLNFGHVLSFPKLHHSTATVYDIISSVVYSLRVLSQHHLRASNRSISRSS